VYWLPIYEVLEGHVQLVVGNAQHIKAVPGRKTDVKDSQWLAELGRHGLIRPSFVPPPEFRALRELLRYRRKLIQSGAAERNRTLKVLERCNIKLASVASDVFGVSGMQMLHALLEGQMSPQQMANLARGTMRLKRAELADALTGTMREPYRSLLKLQLDRMQRVEADLAKLDEQIAPKLEPYQGQIRRLCQIPGVKQDTAAVLIAELGVDMSVFPSAQHISAWAGVCPGNNESAGRKKPSKVRKGNVHLKTALVMAAKCAARKKGSYLRTKYYRLMSHLKPLQAQLALAHKILICAYHMLRDEQDYKELGGAYLDLRKQKQVRSALVRRLEQMGYQVKLEPKAA
jgi:transposase